MSTPAGQNPYAYSPYGGTPHAGGPGPRRTVPRPRLLVAAPLMMLLASLPFLFFGVFFLLAPVDNLVQEVLAGPRMQEAGATTDLVLAAIRIFGGVLLAIPLLYLLAGFLAFAGRNWARIVMGVFRPGSRCSWWPLSSRAAARSTRSRSRARCSSDLGGGDGALSPGAAPVRVPSLSFARLGGGHRLGRALRAGQRRHPRRGELAGPGLPAVGGTPRFMVGGAGPWLTDADGPVRRPRLLLGPDDPGSRAPGGRGGRARPRRRGLSSARRRAGEVELAEEIVRRVPPVEQVRLVNSGTEATMSAIRLARGFTGRAGVVKFAGCYHGHVDALLAAAGSGVATFGLPDSPGVTGARRRTRSCCPTTTSTPSAARSPSTGPSIACVITEAAAGNMGAVAPATGFNAGLRRDLPPSTARC